MDEQFLQAVEEVTKERQLAGAMQDGAQGMQQAQPPGVLKQAADGAMGFLDQAAQFIRSSNQPTESAQRNAELNGGVGPAAKDPVGKAIVTGPAMAAFQTRDFMAGLTGESTDPADRSQLRKTIEGISNEARAANPVAGIAGGISQFVTGLIGAGKLMAPLKATQTFAAGGKAAEIGLEIAKGATAGAVVMDPHEARLSNMIQEFPALENPVSEYLAANPDDSAAEGRLKNALEGAGVDLAFAGAFALGLKAIKFARRGNPEAAKKVVEEIAQPQVAEEMKAAAEKPRVKVQAPSQVVPAPVVEKPKVRVKAQSQASREGIQPTDQISEPAPATVDQSTPLPDSAPSAAKTLPTEAVSDEQMKAILDGTDWDLRAIDQAGSREEAISQGYKPAPEAGVPWQKLQTPEDVSTLIANAQKVLRPELDAVKGGAVLSDAKVERQVRAAARYFNEDPAAVVGEIAQAGDAAAGMVRNMEAGYLVSNRLFIDAFDPIRKVRWGNLEEFGGDSAKALAESRRRLSVAMETYAAAQSMKSAAGRSLRRMRSEFRVNPEQIKALTSLDDQKFMDIMQSTGGDPKKLKDLAKPTVMKRVMDELQFSQRNGLLWLYPTHVVNLTSNVFMQIARPLEKGLGSLVLSGGKAVRQQAAKEFYYTAAAITDGWKAGVEAFMKGDSKLAPHMTDWLDAPSASTAHQPLGVPNFKPFDSWENLWHNLHLSSLYRNVTGFPTRFLGAQDEFFKTVRYRSVVQSRAAVAGEQMGLKGQDLKEFVESRLYQAFDDEGRAVDPEALLEAQTSTFNQELLPGTLGAGIRNLRTYYPPIGFVLPFVKTPINVLRYSHKYTPGLNLIQGEYRAMLLGKVGTERQAQAIGQMALGSLFMASAGLLVANGRVTGGGPSDDQLRKQLIEQGWKPYSVVVTNADGSKTYVPYGRFDPVGLPMGIMADLHELYTMDPEHRDISNIATATGVALARNFSDRTFLLNMNQLVDALSDPENKMEKFVGNMGSSMIPMSSALRGYGNQDPYLREARGLLDRVLKDIPGYSKGLPPRRDVFGEPVARRIGVTTTMSEDPVEAEVNRIMLETNEGLSMPQPTHNGLDLRDVTLKSGQNAYDRYQELAAKPEAGVPSLKESLERLIRSKDYEDMPDGETGQPGSRLNAIQGIVQKYRQAGFKKLQEENPELRTQMLQHKYKAAAKFFDNQTGSSGLGDQLRKALGLTTAP